MPKLQQIPTLQHYDELNNFLEKNKIPKSKICLVGSTCLSVRQLREHGDIDVAVHSSVDSDILEQNSSNVCVSADRYQIFDLPNDVIIDDSRYHDEIGEYKVIRPEVEFSYKKYRKKEKDMADVELLYQYRTEADDWSADLEFYDPPKDIRSLLNKIQSNPSNARREFQWYRKENSLFGSEGYKKRSVSIVGRAIESYKRDGVKKTFGRGVRLLKENEPTGLFKRYSNPIRKIRLGSVVEEDLALYYSVRELLNEQFDGDEFTRYDLAVKYVLADNTVNKQVRESIKNSVDSLNCNFRYDKEKSTDSVQIDYDRRIRGNDTFVQALVDGRDTVEVDIRPGGESREYRRSWLGNTQLSESEVELIEEKLTELLHRYGLLFQVVLWPPAETFMNDIIDYINEHGDIRTVDVLELDEKEFDDCVMDLYAVRDQNMDFIRDKIDVVSDYGSTIHVLSVKLADPELRDGDSKKMVYIKEELRRRFIPEISLNLGKVRPLVHGTDDYEHNILTRDVIENYCADYGVRTSVDKIIE